MSSLLCLILMAIPADGPIETGDTPPPGFTSMFDGKSLSAWKDGGGHWTAKDGILHYDGKGDSLLSAENYGDFELYVDWKIGPKGDSGIYLRGKPQVQIWDDPIGSGGLYNNKKGPSKPLVVADRPVGEWNTFHIVMKGDRVTVDLNGKRVVEDTPLENWPDYKDPLPATGTIELQHHGNPLEFRRIYVKKL